MSSRLSLASLGFLFCLLVAVEASAGRVAVLVMNDGQKRSGEVVEENAETITLMVANVRTPFKRSDIKSVEYVKSIQEEYEIKRAQIADDSIDERLKLARWLYDAKEYPLAKKELDDLAKRAKDNATVQFLHRLVNEKIKIDTGKTGPGNTTDNPGNTTQPDKPGALPSKRLTDKEINAIRVYELDETKDPRVIVPPAVLEKFITEFSNHEDMPKTARDRSKFKAAKGLEQLQMMFKIKASGYYGDVIVRDDPPAIKEFRNIHRNYVLSYCATAECHGGANAGKFFLFNSQPTSDETIHTNFYILTQTVNPKAFMVDRDYPEKSLLIQYGMPEKLALFPHPQVPGWKAHMLRGDKDPGYAILHNWVKSLFRPTPKYGLDYKLPMVESKVPAVPTVPKTPTTPAPTTPKAPDTGTK